MSTATAQPSLLEAITESFRAADAAEAKLRKGARSQRGLFDPLYDGWSIPGRGELVAAVYDHHAGHTGGYGTCQEPECLGTSDACSDVSLWAAIAGSDNFANVMRSLHESEEHNLPFTVCEEGECANTRVANTFEDWHREAGHGTAFWCCTDELCRAADGFASNWSMPDAMDTH